MRILLVLLVLALAGCSTFNVHADLTRQVGGDWRNTVGGRDVTGRPLARISAGFEPELSSTLTATLGIEHQSYPTTRADRGEERAYVGLTWRPFAGGAR